MDGCGSKLLAVLVLVLCCCAPATAIKCYTATSDRAGVIATEFKDPKILCVRFQHVCTKDDSACTAKDVGKLKWTYIVTDSSTCSDMKKTSNIRKNVLCCNSNLCNAPDAKLDPATKIVPGELKLGSGSTGVSPTTTAGPTKKP